MRIELPLCRWRGQEIKADCYECSSTQIIHKDCASSNVCKLCPVANHEPVDLSLIQKAANLVKAIMKHAANGLECADNEVIKQRISVCETCPQNVDRTCMACGCCIDIKATWRSAYCPLRKWPGDDALPTKPCGCG